MGLINLKSDLSLYKPNTDNVKQAEISFSKNKTVKVAENKVEKVSLINMTSTLGPQSNNIKLNKDTGIPDSIKIDKDWLLEKELFDYNSILRVGEIKKFDNSPQKIKSINLIRNDKVSDVKVIDSKYDLNIINYFKNDILKDLKVKDNNSIKKIEYDLDRLKSDIILDTLKESTVLNATIIEKKLSYEQVNIEYSKQSPKIFPISKDKIVIPTIDLTKFDNDELIEIYNTVNKDIKELDVKGVNLISNFNNISKNKDIINGLDFVGQTKQLRDFDNNPIKRTNFPSISNNSLLSGRHNSTEFIKSRVQVLNLESLNSLFDDLIRNPYKDGTFDKTNNTFLNIKKLSGVNFLSDNFQDNFKIYSSIFQSDFNFNEISNYGFRDIPSVKNFIINVEPLVTRFKIINSKFSNPKNTTVDFIENVNSVGFTRFQDQTEFKFETTDYRWKNNVIPSANFFDISNLFAEQFVLRQSLLDTKYNNNVSQFVWKDTNIPVVNYFDRESEYQDGFTLRTLPRITNFKNDSSEFVWKGDNINKVDFWDIFQKYQSGFNLRTPLLKTYYKENSSNFDFDTPPSVNYFDIRKRNSVLGFRNNTPSLETDYIKDSSMYDWDGNSQQGPSVNFFDRQSRHQDGFNKFSKLLETKYINDTSEFVWKGNNVINIDFFDIQNDFTRKGFKLRQSLLETDYINDRSEFVWFGNNINPVDYFDISKNFQKGFTLRQKLLSSDFNLLDISIFQPQSDQLRLNILGVNYFDLTFNNSNGFIKNTLSGITDYKTTTSNIGFVPDSTVDFFTSNIAGFGLRFTDRNKTNYIQGDSIFDDLENQKYNANNKFTTGQTQFGDRFDIRNNVLGTPADYNKLFKRPVELVFIDYKSQGSVEAVNFFDDNLSRAKGFITKQDNKLFSNFYQTKNTFPVNNIWNNSNPYSKYDFNPEQNTIKNRILTGRRGRIQFETDNYTLSNILDLNSKIIYSNLSNEEYKPDFLNNEPYVRRGLMNPDVLDVERYSLFGLSFDDGMSRAGTFVHAKRQKEDFKRITKFMSSGRGIGFLLRQTLLQRSNPSVESYPDEALGPVQNGMGSLFGSGGNILEQALRTVKRFLLLRPTQTYNPLSLMLSVKSAVEGERPIRHGIMNNGIGDIVNVVDAGISAVASLFGGSSGGLDDTDFFNSIGRGEYETIVKKRNLNSNERTNLKQITYSKSPDDEGVDNRLLMLTKELFPDWLTINSYKTSFDPNIKPMTKGQSVFKSLKKIGKKVIQTFVPPNIAGILNGSNFSAAGDEVYFGKTIFKLSSVTGVKTRFGLGETNVRRYEITNNSVSLSWHLFTPDWQYASKESNSRSTSGIRTKEADNLDNDRKMLSSDASLIYTNYRILNDSENFLSPKDDMIFELPDKKHIVKNPFNVVDGSLRDLNKYKEKKQYVSQESETQSEFISLTRNIDEEKLNRVQYDESKLLSNFRKLFIDLEKFGEDNKFYKIKERGHSVKNPFNKINGTLGNSYQGKEITQPLGDYLTMHYEDIQLLAKNLKEDRSTYRNNKGMFGTLAKIKGGLDKFKTDERYKDRLKFLAVLCDGSLPIEMLGLGDQGYGYYTAGKKVGTRIERNDPYWFKFPSKGKDTPLPKDKLSYEDALKQSRGDKINLINILNNVKGSFSELYKDPTDGTKTTGDFVRLIFSNASYNPYIVNTAAKDQDILVFRATMDSVSDSFSPSWGSSDVMGRAESVYMYEGFARSISFSFQIVATTLEEQFSNWRKINELAGYTAPDFGTSGNSRMLGPMMRLTIGDLYTAVPGFLDNLSFDFDFSAGFEMANGNDCFGNDLRSDLNNLALPTSIKVTVSYRIIGNYRAERGGKMFELKNEHGTDWHTSLRDTPTIDPNYNSLSNGQPIVPPGP